MNCLFCCYLIPLEKSIKNPLYQGTAVLFPRFLVFAGVLFPLLFCGETNKAAAPR